MKLDYNPLTGRTVEVKEEDGLIVIRETVPKAAIQKILDGNKAEYNNIPHKQYKTALRKKNFWSVANIPNIIVEKWKKEEGIDIWNDDDWPKVRAKLNSEEYRFLRTSPGKI